MNKFIQALKSRTIWTMVVILLINIIPAVRNSFPNTGWLETVNTVLLIIAGYFKINPTQIYAPAGSTVTAETPNTTVITTPSV
jgi:uncharacterized protein with HEPN domain